MFWAINKTTNERIHSIEIFKNSSYQFPHKEEWIADPDEIFNWKELQQRGIQEIKVIYVSHKEYFNYNGKKVYVSPHFRILNKEELGINLIPESREHKLAKNWIFNRIVNNDLKLNYAKINKPKEYNNFITLNEFELDLNKLGIEVKVSDLNNSKIADVIIPFKNKHEFFGDGIVFEIQLSKQKIFLLEKRTFEWSLKKFSTVWLDWEDFEELNEELIELKKDEVKLQPYCVELKLGLANLEKNFIMDIQYQSRLIDEKIRDCIELLDKKVKEVFTKMNIDFPKLIEMSEQEAQTYLTEYFIDKGIEDSLEICPICKIGMLKIRNSTRGKFIGCSNYPSCKYSRRYPKTKDDRN